MLGVVHPYARVKSGVARRLAAAATSTFRPTGRFRSGRSTQCARKRWSPCLRRYESGRSCLSPPRSHQKSWGPAGRGRGRGGLGHSAVGVDGISKLSRITEHQGARDKVCPPIRGPRTQKHPCDGGHAYQIVLLFERPVVGTGRANDIFDPPAGAGRQQMHAHGHHATLAIFPKHRPELSS